MTNAIELTAAASYLPEKVVTNDDLSKIMATNDQWIRQHTGIRQRRFALKENTSDLCYQVAKKLLDQSGLTASQIDLIIVATITPDALTPATAVLVQDKLKADNAFAFDISAACAGFVFALSTAEKFLRSGNYQHAIVLAGEVNSKMLNFKDRTSAVFFGDGAGGVLLSATTDQKKEFFCGEKLLTNPQPAVIHSGRIPVIKAISPDQYPQIDAFYQNGHAVYDFVANEVPKYISSFLAAMKLRPEELGAVISHQANLRLIEQLAAKLKLPLSRFVINVDQIGNTSSAGVAIGLAQLLQTGRRPQNVLLTGFGAGLAFGCLLVNLKNF